MESQEENLMGYVIKSFNEFFIYDLYQATVFENKKVDTDIKIESITY